MAQVASESAVAAEHGPELGGGEPSSQVIGRSPWELFWRRFRQDRFAFVGIVFIGLMVILAFTAPLFAKLVHHGPNQVFIREVLDEFGLPKGPNGQFWFGADDAGRDLFVRVLYGARTSLVVAFFATGISVVIGVAVGMVAGFYRGKVDTFISRGSSCWRSASSRRAAGRPRDAWEAWSGRVSCS